MPKLYLNEIAPWERKRQYQDQVVIKGEVVKQTGILERQLAVISANYPSQQEPSLAYETYLNNCRYLGDISKGISSFADNLEDRMYDLQDGISDLAEGIAYGLSTVHDGIASMRSEFNAGLGKVLVQFELSRKETNDGINFILETLRNERKVKAEEHLRDALEFYTKGCAHPHNPEWFDSALNHFLAAIELNERNSIAHLHLGHIYHYQKNLRDMSKALKHYRLCYVFGEGSEKEHTIAAQGCFYAGWLAAVVFKNLDEAIKYSHLALNFDAELCEAHYNLTKFYSLKGDSANAIKHLAIAIEKFDRNYLIKAEADPDCMPILPEIHKLNQHLKEKSAREFAGVLAQIIDLLTAIDRDLWPVIKDAHAETKAKNLTFDEELKTAVKESKIKLTDYWKPAFKKDIEEVEHAAMARDTYFNYLDATSYLLEIRLEIEAQKQKEADSLKTSLANIIARKVDERTHLEEARAQEKAAGLRQLEEKKKRLEAEQKERELALFRVKLAKEEKRRKLKNFIFHELPSWIAAFIFFLPVLIIASLIFGRIPVLIVVVLIVVVMVAETLGLK